MSKPNKEYPIIHYKVYEEKRNRGEHYTGYVVQEDGKVTFAVSEHVMLSAPEILDQPIDKFSTLQYGKGIKYHENPTPYVCSQDNIRIVDNSISMERRVKLEIESETVKKNVRTNLINALRKYFEDAEARRMADNGTLSMFGVSIDVNNPQTASQKEFAKLKNKIMDKTLVRNDFTSNMISNMRSDIDSYFACFDPLDPNNYYFWNGTERQDGIGQPGFWEGLVPFWGSGRSAVDHFQNDNYWRGAGYTVLAITDVFLVRSIFTGVAKGAWKFGAHSWGATRAWTLKTGWATKNAPLHHWFLHQKTINKYNLQWFGNQPWNLKAYPNASRHMRYGHGKSFKGAPAGSQFEQLWFGTPNWPKYMVGSYGVRPVIGAFDEE